MKILLIRNNDPGSFSETNITGVYPPLGLAYIASVLKRCRHQVSFIDNQVLRLNEHRLKDKIKRADPEMALLSSMTPSWPGAVKLSRLIKDISPQIITGVGGPHLSAYPRESLAEESFDFGVYGEGENTILEIVENIQAGKALDGVRGSIFRKNNQVVVNAPRQESDDLDTIPFPLIELLPYRKYIALSVDSPFFTIVTSRGCPYKCKFCFQGYLGKYRARSPENIVNEIETLVNEYSIREIIVFDETFAVEEQRVLNICKLIQKKRIKFKWDIRTRVDLLNERVLFALKSTGCGRIHLGIESGNQRTLCEMGKMISTAEVKDKVNLAKKLGFEIRGYFMLAYPKDTYKSIFQTIEFAKALPLDWASFTVTIGLPETEIYKQALSSREFPIDYWREYSKGSALGPKPYFIPAGMKEKDLFVLKRKAYSEFYLRPKIIWNILRKSNLIGMVKSIPLFIRISPSLYHSILRI